MKGGVRFPRAGSWSRHATMGLGAVCLLPAVLGALLSLAHCLPLDPVALSGVADAPPSSAHWLGTDALGRDIFSRLADASANFAAPGLVAIAVAVVAGGALGVAEGLGGPGAGALSLWAVQVLDSVPRFVLVLLVASIVRSELLWIMAAVGLTFVPQVAGVVHSSIERLKVTAFIEAERSLGVGLARIVFVHILWGHARGLILAQLTSLGAYALLVETSLSYLGGELGFQEPGASWGNMIALARDGVFRGHVLPAVAPAALISLTLLGFSLVGQGFLRVLEERV